MGEERAAWARLPRQKREKELRWYHDNFNTPDDLAIWPPQLDGGVSNPSAALFTNASAVTARRGLDRGELGSPGRVAHLSKPILRSSARKRGSLRNVAHSGSILRSSK